VKALTDTRKAGVEGSENAIDSLYRGTLYEAILPNKCPNNATLNSKYAELLIHLQHIPQLIFELLNFLSGVYPLAEHLRVSRNCIFEHIGDIGHRPCRATCGVHVSFGSNKVDSERDPQR